MPVNGYLDGATRQVIRGWAWDPDRAGEPVELDVIVDGRLATSVIANAYRVDLEAAGIGNGRHGFSVDATTLGLSLADSVVHVRETVTGADLVGSPVRIEGQLEFDAPAVRAMVALLQSPGDRAALHERLRFLAQQADMLVQAISDQQSDRQARAARRSRKWRWQSSDGAEPQQLTPRALVIDHTLPRRARDAGSNAILSHMASLQRIGFEVTFVPADLRGEGHADALIAAGIAVQSEPWIGTVEEVLRRQSGEFDLVYLHRVDMAQRYMELIKHYMPKARIIFSVADLHHLRLFRQIQVEDRPEASAYANHVRLRELSAAAASHAIVTHSAFEAGLLRQAVPAANVIVVPWDVPCRPTPAVFSKRAGIAFIGSYGHKPNLDAAIWLLDEIMPLVWRSAPKIKCLLAGSGMPGLLKSDLDPRIVPIGAVDDLDDVLGQVRLTVAPLSYGAGLKGKVADSLAAGVPCVCTPIAAEGFSLPAPLTPFVADSAAGLADAIIRLHGDKAAFAACRAAGLDYVRQAFSEAVVDRGLRQAAGLPAL